MTWDSLVLALASAALGGGGIAGATTIYQAKKKTPVEVDNIVINGAETAVVTLEKVLAAETRRADRAESLLTQRDEALARKDARIAALEERLDQLQTALDAARDELHAILTQPL